MLEATNHILRNIPYNIKTVLKEWATKHGFDTTEAYLEWRAAKILGRPITDNDRPIPMGIIFLYDYGWKPSKAELKAIADWSVEELERLKEV